MKVLVRVRGENKAIRPKDAKAIAMRVLGVMGLEGYELSLLLVGDKEMAKINREFLGRDGATNVIAFSQIEGGGPASGGQLLGDVVISVDTCNREARECGASFEERFMELLVHGILHLLGHEHEGDEELARLMEVEEERILRALGIAREGHGDQR